MDKPDDHHDELAALDSTAPDPAEGPDNSAGQAPAPPSDEPVPNIGWIPIILADCFPHLDITLLVESLKTLAPGRLDSGGWSIRYCFGEDERGLYLDFYATRAMSYDRHVRIHAHGVISNLPTPRSHPFYPPDASPEQCEAVERDNEERNRRLMDELRRKWFR